jgi:hypothetical protein
MVILPSIHPSIRPFTKASEFLKDIESKYRQKVSICYHSPSYAII